MPINVDMVLFKRHVDHGNYFFNLPNSSLRWLVAYLNGFAPRNTLPGAIAAMRNGIAEDEIIDRIFGPVPGGAAIGTQPIPLEKRRRYRRALGYLFDLMGLPPGGVGQGERLVQKPNREIKTNWAAGATQLGQHFIHCSGVTPQQINAAGGFDPRFGKEFVAPQPVFGGAGVAFPGHEFTFFFERAHDDDNPVIVSNNINYGRIGPNAAARRLGFGVGGFMYLMRPPPGVVLWSTGGQVANNAECGFPALVPLAQLVPLRWTANGPEQLTWAGTVVPHPQPVI